MKSSKLEDLTCYWKQADAVRSDQSAEGSFIEV